MHFCCRICTLMVTYHLVLYNGYVFIHISYSHDLLSNRFWIQYMPWSPGKMKCCTALTSISRAWSCRWKVFLHIKALSMLTCVSRWGESVGQSLLFGASAIFHQQPNQVFGIDIYFMSVGICHLLTKRLILVDVVEIRGKLTSNHKMFFFISSQNG